MSYSDYDSDGYSSNEDKDYVPSEDNLSEDDMNECVKEDGLEGDEDQAQQPIDATRKKMKKKTKGADLGMRKRKKGGLRLEEDKEKDGKTEEKREEPLEEEAGLLVGRADPAVKEEVQKKKADDLWASFLSDVGSKPKPPTPSTTPQAEPPLAVASSTPRPSAPIPSQPARVTITKVFDFAGEEVRVTKEVSSQSKEAKSYLKEQEQEGKPEDPSPAACKPLGPGPSAKRPVGMGSILNRLGGKKAKMSTLEKSKMDWDTFKSEEGITEELAIHNRGKEGYVERKNFLERVDHRQFELEKKVRLNNMKR